LCKKTIERKMPDSSSPPATCYCPLAEVEKASLELTDGELLDMLQPAVRDWWTATYEKDRDINGGYFTPPQRLAIPLIHRGENVLVAAPTGSGKTLAAFTSIINELFRISVEEGGLKDAVYCIYISPLRSLANDISRNLEEPLRQIYEMHGAELPLIRQAIRHGDTRPYARSRQLAEPPHILNTTPETLGILLSAPRFRELLRDVRWVIVDEVHALADNKRGVFLSLALERLEHLVDRPLVRIGCSATVEPLDEVARFLVGQHESEDRRVHVADSRFLRDYDLKLLCPTPDIMETTPEELSQRFYEDLHDLIQQHRCTLIFTNARSGAERVLYNLRRRYPDHYDRENSGCHHGSLGKGSREDVEKRLKNGEIKFVTTSTSLELGVDMPHLDLVVQVGSPKSVSALLQRVGRAGHRLGEMVKGRIIAMDPDELVECAVMLQKAKDGFIDPVHIPRNCLDVLAQHLFGMVCDSEWSLADAAALVRRSYCYRELHERAMTSVIDYLSARDPRLQEKGIYGKLWYDEERGRIGRRGRTARMVYFTNLGVIPDTFECEVFTRGDEKWMGSLDEHYLESLETGDVFVLGGGVFEFRYRRGSKVYVDTSTQQPTVPSWYSERLPLSYEVALHVQAFREEAVRHASKGDLREWLERRFQLDGNSLQGIVTLFMRQIAYGGTDSVATPDRIVIEEHEDLRRYRRSYYVHTNYGRRFNDGLSRLLARRVAGDRKTGVTLSVTDTGFALSVPHHAHADVAGALKASSGDVVGELRQALHETQVLRRAFRHAATRSLLILRNWKGRAQTARRQQFSADMLLRFTHRLDGFPVLEEAYREVMEDRMEVKHVTGFLRRVGSGKIGVVTKQFDSPSPLAIGIASLSASETFMAGEQSKLVRELHRRVLEKLGEATA